MNSLIYRKTLLAPFGNFTLYATGDALVYAAFDNELAEAKRARYFAAHYPHHVLSEGENDVIALASQELSEYFAGDRTDFSVALDYKGTRFQNTVWANIHRIPYGKIITYQNLADISDCPKGSRSVGAGCGANPIPVIVPCHRILGTSRGLTGFGGGLDVKVWLLQHEGHTIENGRFQGEFFQMSR